MERSPDNQTVRRKAVLKKRKISKTAISHWKSLSDEKQSFLMILLQEAVEPFIGSGDDEINVVLRKIKQSFRELVDVAKVPNDKWLAPKAIYSHRAKLLEEQAEEKSLETHLLSILAEKKRDGVRMHSKSD